MVFGCDADAEAITLSEAFKISKREYEEITKTVGLIYMESKSIVGAMEELAKKYKDPCKFILAVFQLGRMDMAVATFKMNVPIIIVPIEVIKPSEPKMDVWKSEKNKSRDGLWG